MFDNVFVPWEHVFIYRNIEVCRDQWWRTPSHLYGNHQAQVRYVTKLRFMIGLAQRMNEMTGNDAQSGGADHDGRARLAGVDRTRGMLLAQESEGADRADGVLWPSKTDALFGDGDAVGVQRPDAGDRSANWPARR